MTAEQDTPLIWTLLGLLLLLPFALVLAMAFPVGRWLGATGWPYDYGSCGRQDE